MTETLTTVLIVSGVFGAGAGCFLMLAYGWLGAPMLLVALGLLGFSISYASRHQHGYPSTTVQANAICHAHKGVKEVQAPGDNGAYIVCRDGFLGHTKSGTYWK